MRTALVFSFFIYLQVYTVPLAFAAFYPTTIKDHIVVKRVYQSVETQDWMHCLVLCHSDVDCSSYNFKLDENEAGNSCELSKCGFGERETTYLISRQGFVFNQLRPVKENHLCRQRAPQKPSSGLCDGLESSLILNNPGRPNTYMMALCRYLGPAKHSWKRCYHSAAPFNQTAFHQLCDSKGPTVTIVRVDEYIFGGYIDKSWKEAKGNCPPVTSDRAFLFSLYNKYGFDPHKFNIRPGASNVAHAAWHCSKFGPAFGHGFDLILYPKPDQSYARPLSYDLPPNCKTSEFCKFYTGTDRFWPSEVEVFYENGLL